jgi:putative hydrolase of the HAD superfamily
VVEHSSRPRAIIFDLGGVIVELGPLSDILGDWVDAEEDFWSRWLHSDTVRDFEGGRCSPQQFGDRLVVEFGLPFSGSELVDRFRRWPKGLFPGAQQLLTELGQQSDLVVAALSNSNPVHWYEQEDAALIRSLFEMPFLSYELELVKPDRAIFEVVAGSLDMKPEDILYFDDNRINVNAAIAAGWKAVVAKGPSDCRRHLASLGIVRAHPQA